MRYAGQNYEQEVPVPVEAMSDERLREAFATFERIHAERYGYAIAGEEIELVAFHVTVTGRRQQPRLFGREETGASGPPIRRKVYFRGFGPLDVPVYRRYVLPPGTHLDGPCILEEAGSTTLVEPGMSVAVLPDRQLLIETGVV
jgi:N-methylhydantoinase A